jgi:hypothetical protein
MKNLTSKEELLNFLSSSKKVYCIVAENELPSLGLEGSVVYKVKDFQGTGRHGVKLILLSNKSGRESNK